jgi:hypothetical protein
VKPLGECTRRKLEGSESMTYNKPLVEELAENMAIYAGVVDESQFLPRAEQADSKLGSLSAAGPPGRA